MRWLVLSLLFAAIGCEQSRPTPPIAVAAPSPPAPPQALPKSNPTPAPLQDSLPSKELMPQKERPKADPFERAWNEMQILALAALDEGAKELGREKATLQSEDVNRINMILSRSGKNETHMSADEILFFDRVGLRRMCTAVRLNWAMRDPLFRTTCRTIWERCPELRVRTFFDVRPGFWGALSSDQRAALAQAIEVAHTGERELTEVERDQIVLFCGRNYPLPLKKPPTFDEAIAKVGAEADRLAKQFAQELPAKRKLLTDEEAIELDAIVDRKGESFTIAEVRFMRENRMAKWVWAKAAKWAPDDPQFLEVAKIIWNRTPKSRNADTVLELAIKWIQMDRSEKFDFVDALKRVEAGEGFAREERDRIIYFAGEEYFSNRP